MLNVFVIYTLTLIHTYYSTEAVWKNYCSIHSPTQPVQFFIGQFWGLIFVTYVCYINDAHCLKLLKLLVYTDYRVSIYLLPQRLASSTIVESDPDSPKFFWFIVTFFKLFFFFCFRYTHQPSSNHGQAGLGPLWAV